MILSELRAYLQDKKTVTLNELVIHFDTDAGALRGMLQKWISKGKLRKLSTDPACGTSCCKCDPTLTEIYEWVESLD